MAPSKACLVEAELRARSAYAQPGRKYHGEQHLDECLGELDRIVDLRADERQLLRWAILWHDAVYDATRDDNEARSAELAVRELTDCNVDNRVAAEVAPLICLTKGHRVGEGDRMGALLVSIDLSILGSGENRYREYAEAVRQEYEHVPDEAWRIGRSAVLQHLLDADPLYPDSGFSARLETQARRNMQQEIMSLRAS